MRILDVLLSHPKRCCACKVMTKTVYRLSTQAYAKKCAKCFLDTLIHTYNGEVITRVGGKKR